MRFEVRSEIAVVDTNPEMADMSNPRGDIHGEVFYVIATDGHGNRQRHFATATKVCNRNSWWGPYKIEQLKSLAEKLNHLQPTLTPEYWQPTHPEYGSRAYLDAEPEIVRAEIDADLRGDW